MALPCKKRLFNQFVTCATGVVYSVPFSCEAAYTRQTGHHLNDCLREHSSLEAALSGHLAVHMWDYRGVPFFSCTGALFHSCNQKARELMAAFLAACVAACHCRSHWLCHLIFLQNCVKHKAMLSVLAVRGVTEAEAMEAVERVFTKCYNDLEPVGRRLRRNSLDMERAYRERYHYGYDLWDCDIRNQHSVGNNKGTLR